MARLIYSAIMSLDGYIADADGRFEWAAPDEEVFAFVNELERPVGTYLYGRRTRTDSRIPAPWYAAAA
jgi:dihydrofolate reductase